MLPQKLRANREPIQAGTNSSTEARLELCQEKMWMLSKTFSLFFFHKKKKERKKEKQNSEMREKGQNSENSQSNTST